MHSVRNAILVGLIVTCPAAMAVPFTAIRIGDVDGFGLGNGSISGATAANGSALDQNANGILDDQDFLPDWNNDNAVATGRGDDFDFRSAAEVGGGSLTGSGYTNTGSAGSDFTDIALSTSYGTSSANGKVYVPDGAGGVTQGAGGPFPKPPPNSLPNQPGFEFRFTVAYGDIDPSAAMFFNVIFGDYDVTPATLKITTNNGSGGPGAIVTLPLTVQGGGKDGLVQAAFTTLSFGQVFNDTGSEWKGYLDVLFDAPNEPYTAFDYAELSVEQIQFTPMPEPASLALLGIGLAGLARARRRS